MPFTDTLSSAEKEREIEEAFDVFDTQKKGYLNRCVRFDILFLIQIGFCRPRFSSREEVKNVLGMLGESTSSLDSLMKDVDLDNDGLSHLQQNIFANLLLIFIREVGFKRLQGTYEIFWSHPCSEEGLMLLCV